ncbi:MAG: hypothetical protein ACD_75C01090G0001, partial [uncultured bacterium]
MTMLRRILYILLLWAVLAPLTGFAVAG